MKVKKETYREMYKRMNEARAFEQKVSWFFSRGMVHGTTHLSNDMKRVSSKYTLRPASPNRRGEIPFDATGETGDAP